MAKLKIKKGDHVVVLTGKDKGKHGEVLKMMPEENRAIVKGIAMITAPSAPDGDAGRRHHLQGGRNPYLQPRDRGSQGWEADAGRVQVSEGRAQGPLCQALRRGDRWLRPLISHGSSSNIRTCFAASS